MVVADDGSDRVHADAYRRTAEAFGSRVVFFQAREAGAPRSGPGAARNRAMARATGEFIAFLDDDDEWTAPDHLEVAITAMERFGADYFFANMRGMRDGVAAIPSYVNGLAFHETGDPVPISLVQSVGVMRHCLIHPNMMVVTRALRESTGWFHEKIRWAEDIDWMLRLADQAQAIVYRPAYVANIRLPEAGSSSLWEGELEHLLDEATAAQHVRAVARTRAVRRCARAREAWTYRQLSLLARERSCGSTAAEFAVQALCVYPTAGAAVHLARTVATAYLDTLR